MEQEFNLSEKIEDFVSYGEEGTNCFHKAIIIENIKEFIKRLKKEMFLTWDNTEIINKLAGEQLIWKQRGELIMAQEFNLNLIDWKGEETKW